MHLTAEAFSFLIVVAFMAGTIDALAGGGGLLTIPALMAAGVPPINALATNKLQSTIGTGSAVLAFLRAGQIDLRAFALPAAGAFLGSVLGATAVQHINPNFLSAFVPLLLIAMGFYFLLAPKMSEVDRQARLGPWGLTAVCAGLGFYDGFFGPGTGSFLTTALVALGGLALLRAIANTKFLNLATNVAGLLAMIAGGKVLWFLGLSMACANVAGNQVGAWLAIRFGGDAVQSRRRCAGVGLFQAGAHCECCDQPAPFVEADGTPFLEVHHVRALGKGGSDTPENTVALCPNCHRELHYGVRSAALVQALYEKVARLVQE